MMVFLIALTGTVVVWLWLFPPEGLSDRARAALLAGALLATAGCAWATVRALDEMNGARKRALTEYQRHEELKEREIRKIRDEDDWRRGGVYN